MSAAQIALVVVPAALLAWRGGQTLWRARRTRIEFTRHGAWRPVTRPHGRLHPEVWSLALMSLGHSRRIRSAWTSESDGQDCFVLDYVFEIGFGERRRLFAFTVVGIEWLESTQWIVSPDDVLIASGGRPGVLQRRLNGFHLSWTPAVGEPPSADRFARLSACLGPDQTCEARPGLLALYDSGPFSPQTASQRRENLLALRALLTRAGRS